MILSDLIFANNFFPDLLTIEKSDKIDFVLLVGENLTDIWKFRDNSAQNHENEHFCASNLNKLL